MTAYYNEMDPYAAQWLRNLISAGLIAPGEVDERSIVDVRPSELAVFTQCHFFAGIGGWSRALRLAGWPDDRPVWTGSCPCQPFSAAGKQQGVDDARHLWPVWFGLIRERRPATVFGEQVAAAVGHSWLDAVQGDLEGEGYAVGAAVLGAHSVGAPHIRQRLWFGAQRVADSQRIGHKVLQREGVGRLADGEHEERSRTGFELGSADSLLADARREDQGGRGVQGPGQGDGAGDGATFERPAGLCADGLLADADDQRFQGVWPDANQEGRAGPDVSTFGLRNEAGFGGVADPHRAGWHCPADANRRVEGSGGDNGTGPLHGFWRDADWLFCRDGKWRPTQSTFQRFPDGLPLGMVPCSTGDGRYFLSPLVQGAPARVGRLRGYGNAIVPQVAAEFIGAFEECRP